MDVGTAALGAWSSGISMYFVAAALGLAGRLDWIATPDWLGEPWVIGVALVLAVVELVVDKVAWLDSAWDVVHTVLRPVAGGVLFSGAETTAGEARSQLWMGLVGAGLALSAHLAKAALRALINMSPEPVSNILVSLTEDGLVASTMGLAIAYPAAALVVAGVLAFVCTVASVLLFWLTVRTWRRWRLRRAERALHRRAWAPTT